MRAWTASPTLKPARRGTDEETNRTEELYTADDRHGSEAIFRHDEHSAIFDIPDLETTVVTDDHEVVPSIERKVTPIEQVPLNTGKVQATRDATSTGPPRGSYSPRNLLSNEVPSSSRGRKVMSDGNYGNDHDVIRDDLAPVLDGPYDNEVPMEVLSEVEDDDNTAMISDVDCDQKFTRKVNDDLLQEHCDVNEGTRRRESAARTPTRDGAASSRDNPLPPTPPTPFSSL